MHIIALFNEIQVKLYEFLKTFFLEKPRLIKLRKFNKTAEFQEKQNYLVQFIYAWVFTTR